MPDWPHEFTVGSIGCMTAAGVAASGVIGTDMAGVDACDDCGNDMRSVIGARPETVASVTRKTRSARSTWMRLSGCANGSSARPSSNTLGKRWFRSFIKQRRTA